MISSDFNPELALTQAEQLMAKVKVPIKFSDDRMQWSNRMWVDGLTGSMVEMGILTPAVENIHSFMMNYPVVELVLPKPVNEFNFAAFLHEFGHFHTKSSVELDAWRWAVKHAAFWTAKMTDAMREALISYEYAIPAFQREQFIQEVLTK